METVISVSAYNSKGKVVNGEWESILAETMIINNGDTIAIKDAYRIPMIERTITK